MPTLCIAVMDAARARLYRFEGGAEATLRPWRELVNAERRSRPNERFSDTRPGSKFTSMGRGYGVDDGRDAHVRDQDRRFAAEVVDVLAALAGQLDCQRVLIAASPKMLGNLRAAIGRLPAGLSVTELDRDLTKLTAPQLHDYLTGRGLLPARGRQPCEVPA